MLTRGCVGIVSLLLVLAIGSSSFAASMSEANQAYQRGNWSEAISGYDELVTQGVVHEDLYYNLGNANFRAGYFGPAIFNYERSLRVQPGALDAQYNLVVARETVAAGKEGRLRGAELDPWWVQASLYLSVSDGTLALLLCNLLFFGGLIILRFVAPGVLRTTAVVLAVFLGFSTATTAVMLAAHVYADEKIHQGIVVAPSAIMREGPAKSMEERGQLHPGLRVTVLSQDSHWLLIRLANGVEGWVPDDSIGLF